MSSKGKGMMVRAELVKTYHGAALKGMIILSGAERPYFVPDRGRVEAARLAKAKHPGTPKGYKPNEYARSVPAKKRGTRSTKGVAIMHSGGNRLDRRAYAASLRHTTYEPRSTTVATHGSRHAAKAAARAKLRAIHAIQGPRLARERAARVRATKERNNGSYELAAS
jgi:hypothetical protein